MTPTNDELAAELMRLTDQPGAIQWDVIVPQFLSNRDKLFSLMEGDPNVAALLAAQMPGPITQPDSSQPAQVAAQQKPLFTADDFTGVGDGIFKRVQKGKPTEYTNVVDSKGRPTMGEGTVPATTKESSLLSANVKARLAAIQSEPNMDAKKQLLAEFQVERATEAANVEASLRQAIEAKYNIPAMRQLATVGSSDAGRAAKYRQELVQAQSLADQELQRAKASNIKLQSLQAYGVMAENEVANATKVDTYRQQKEILADNSTKMTPEQKKQALLESTRPEVIRRMKILDPSLAGKDDADIAVMIAGNTKGGKVSISPEELATLQASPQQLIGMAAKGSQAALKMFVEEEKALTGEDTSRDIQNVQAALRNPDSVKRLAATFFGSVDSEGYKAFNLAQSKAATSKEAKAEFDSAATNMAVSVMAANRTNKAAADVSNWAVADEALKQVIGNIKSSGRPADILTVAREYGKTLPREQRAQAIETMKNMVNANLAKYDKSLLGPVDKDKIIRSMEDEIAKSRMGELLSTVSGVVGTAAEMGGVYKLAGSVDYGWKYLFDPAAK